MSNNIFESKRFWSSVAAVVAMVVVSFVPEFQNSEQELASLFETVVLALIAGYTITDALKLLPTVLAEITKFLANRNEG